MRKKLIYSLSLLFLLFALGAGLTMLYIHRVTTDLQSVVNLHRIEIIRQNLVINAQTVQSNLYATGTVFGKELDVIVENVTALDASVRGCSGCHHSPEMTTRLNEVSERVEQYKEAISYLITTTANQERIERLKMVAVGIGDELLGRTQEMALIAERSLNDKTVRAVEQISNSKIILITTLILAFFIALVIAAMLTRRITEPVYALVEATRMIADGELGYETPYRDTTEFGELAKNFNLMSRRLKEERGHIVRYVEQLSGLYHLTLSLYQITDMEDAYQDICRGIAHFMKAEQCALLFYDRGSDAFVSHRSAFGLTEQERRLLTFSKRRGEELFEGTHGLPLVSNNPLEDVRVYPSVAHDPHGQALAIAWLQRKGRLLGALWVANKNGGFTDEDAKLLTIIANHMAVALENAELYRYLQEQMEELRRTQEQLIQSAKLVAIGELASNVAHEINNPLTSIIGFTEILKDENDVTIIRNRLDIIEKESLRARDIVRQLLQFARKRPLELTRLDINDVVRGVLPLVAAEARAHGIEIREGYAELPETVADSNQVKQVFLNLINNALAVMPDGGALSITTSRRGELILIDFSDTGPGIPAEILPRIFEPFFTTKQEKGTGLGLSISYRIIQDHGGRIDVQSTVGHGATFTVRLPIRNMP